MTRTRAIPVAALVLAALAVAVTVLLQREAERDHDAASALQSVKLELAKLQNAPFRADATAGGSPRLARQLLTDGKATVTETLAGLEGDDAPSELGDVSAPLRANYGDLERIYTLGASGVGYQAEADQLASRAAGAKAEADTLLDAAGDEYQSRAGTAANRATGGAVLSILLLLGAFLFYYSRSVQTARENRRILEETRRESRTDELTGLGNRRALMNDLADGADRLDDGDELLLALFDLDGFKHYNDTFGHPAGDALLARLGRRLATCVEGEATAYRMGGDEFCVLARMDGDAGLAVGELGAAALREDGEGFDVGCSYGTARVPSEAADGSAALGLADQRLYSAKAGRASASRQTIDVLLRVLSERTPGMGEHLSAVAALAEPVAEALGSTELEVRRVHMAAELHDIGKTGIPDAILNKPGPLDEDEWRFMRRHTLIGERIVLAAPSLAGTGDLVRSSHEHLDGTGYPDGLSGDAIPMGSRIILACDAFDAMTSDRPYRAARSTSEAVAELRICAGTQFDPEVVEALAALVEGDGGLWPRMPDLSRTLDQH